MRITNGIMINNSLSNINKNKETVDKLNTQITSEKQIQRASEDPILAVRSLRLRSTLAEINQYLDANIPDARQWLDTTETALSTTADLLENFIYYCNQGVNDYNTVSERNTLITQLKQYQQEMYSTANADYAGRTVFTGYKTDRGLTFTDADNPSNLSYTITETFDFNSIDVVNKVIGAVDSSTVAETTEYDVTNKQVYRALLAYDDIDLSSLSTDNLPSGISFTEISLDAYGDAAYNVGTNEIRVIPETGEVLIGSGAYETLKNSSDSGFTISYSKTGFETGDLRPEHYFDCVDTTDADNPVTYTFSEQSIEYEINFSTSMSINTLGCNTFNTGMVRYIDDLIESVGVAINAQNTISDIEKQMAATDDEDTIATLQTMLDAANIELAYAEENMSDLFAAAITHFQEYSDKIDLAIADVGTKGTRLDLNEDRLESQKLSVTSLKSQNEDINVTEVAVLYSQAQDVYDASLTTASQIVQKSLLDFL